MWPRWEVFKKDNGKKPYQAVGSVHAVDPEHALLNAKNVFVRRPAAVSLWVTPAAAILSRSLEEIEAAPPQISGHGEPTSFEIFRKGSHRRSMTFMNHLGQIEAPDPESALALAISQFDDQPGLAWWVVPSQAIYATDDGVAPAWFDPAKTKTYKQQSQYGFVSKRRSGRKGDVTHDAG